MTKEYSLEPTHTCFDDALDLIVELVKHDPRLGPSDDLKLVHAICKTPAGELFSHAWVENIPHNICMFAGILNGARQYFKSPLPEYYATFSVQECTKYSVKDAILMNWKHGTYGPWEERYEKLCGQSKKILA